MVTPNAHIGDTTLGGELGVTRASRRGASGRLLARDYVSIYAPIVLPFFIVRLGASMLNSVAFAAYYAYAALIVLSVRGLRAEHWFFLLSMVLLAFQIVVGNRLGLNSSLSLIMFVVVYKEVISRIGVRRAIGVLTVLYALNMAYMVLEVISQFGVIPSLLIPNSPFSIVPGLQLCASLYMQIQASGLVSVVAAIGAIVGASVAQTRRERLVYIVAAFLGFALVLINMHGTAFVSLLVAAVIVGSVALMKRTPIKFAVGGGIIIVLVIHYLDVVTRLVGFRFVDPTTGEINQALVDVYIHIFSDVVRIWRSQPLIDRLIGRPWSPEGQNYGDFGFGNMLLIEGAIVLVIYLSFVVFQCVRGLAQRRFSGKGNSLLYYNVAATLIYVVSLIHYVNAAMIGAVNLLAFHIALNVALIESAKADGPARGPHVWYR